MDEMDRMLITETVSVMHGLRADMREFRGEMKEFKEQTIVRVTALEERQMECQKNPSTCATARVVENHLAGHKGNRGLAVSIWAVCISTVMCVFTLAMAFFKGGKP